MWNISFCCESKIQLCKTTNINYRISHSNLQVYRLGSKEQNTKCNHMVLQHVAAGNETEEAMLMTPFSSMEEWKEYNNKLGEIKNIVVPPHTKVRQAVWNRNHPI